MDTGKKKIRNNLSGQQKNSRELRIVRVELPECVIPNKQNKTKGEVVEKIIPARLISKITIFVSSIKSSAYRCLLNELI